MSLNSLNSVALDGLVSSNSFMCDFSSALDSVTPFLAGSYPGLSIFIRFLFFFPLVRIPKSFLLTDPFSGCSCPFPWLGLTSYVDITHICTRTHMHIEREREREINSGLAISSSPAYIICLECYRNSTCLELSWLSPPTNSRLNGTMRSIQSYKNTGEVLFNGSVLVQRDVPKDI